MKVYKELPRCKRSLVCHATGSGGFVFGVVGAVGTLRREKLPACVCDGTWGSSCRFPSCRGVRPVSHDSAGK